MICFITHQKVCLCLSVTHVKNVLLCTLLQLLKICLFQSATNVKNVLFWVLLRLSKVCLFWSATHLKNVLLWASGVLHWRCISRKFVIVRLHPDDAALSAAVQPPCYTRSAGGRPCLWLFCSCVWKIPPFRSFGNMCCVLQGASILTPSLPWCHFKTTKKIAKFETLPPFCLFFTLACERIFIKTNSI